MTDAPQCDTCSHIMDRAAKRPTCRLYPRDEPHPISGRWPPYHYCLDVLRVTRKNPLARCMHHSSEEPKQYRLVLEEIEE